MTIETQTALDGTSVAIRLSGDLDLYAAPRLRTTVVEILVEGAERIDIDMAGISYLDSSGVGAIVSLIMAARRRGAAISFKGIAGHARIVLERTHLMPLIGEAVA
jgi:anti-sigma B factor antagonist